MLTLILWLLTDSKKVNDSVQVVSSEAIKYFSGRLRHYIRLAKRTNSSRSIKIEKPQECRKSVPYHNFFYIPAEKVCISVSNSVVLVNGADIPKTVSQ